jgi:hypothetical protein
MTMTKDSPQPLGSGLSHLVDIIYHFILSSLSLHPSICIFTTYHLDSPLSPTQDVCR